MSKKLNLVADESYRSLIAPLISFPDDLEVFCNERGSLVEIETRANFADNGQLLGVNWQTRIAIQEVLSVIAAKHSADFQLARNLLPSETGSAPDIREFKGDTEWTPTKALRQLNAILNKICDYDFEIKIAENNAEFMTKFRIVFSRKEQLAISVGQIGFHLSRIFNSGWKKHGRKIFITGSESAT